MDIDVITLFPHLFDPVFNSSIMGRARDSGIYRLRVHNLRDYTDTKHRVVDDYPFGGGTGMVLKPEPLWKAVETLKNKYGRDNSRVILTSPTGRVFNHKVAMELKDLDWIVLICGHYEGVDERVRQYLIDEEISTGDYILTGGELPAMVIIDAVVRLLPGVLPEESVQTDSFYTNILSYPQYTRPRTFLNYDVPDILLSGNHSHIKKWRRARAVERTLKLRPELLTALELSEEDRKIINDLLENQ